MNEFTKNDLEWIATSITAYDFDSISLKEQHQLKSALNKVLTMIDNYDSKEFSCEHCGCLRSKNYQNAFCCEKSKYE